MLSSAIQIYTFKKTSLERSDNLRPHKQNESVFAESPAKVICVACRDTIAYQLDCVSMQGSHQHTVTNPAGYIYHIRCYSSVINCRMDPEKTLAYSWFEGYAWQCLYCANCKTHLGWRFSNNDEFYALISNRIADDLTGTMRH